jgi:hypothetical protein
VFVMIVPAVLPVSLLLALLALVALPDGARAGAPGNNGAIAFVGDRSGEAVLYVRRGGRTSGLVRGGGLGDPVWSPTGRRLALTRELPDTGRAIWVMSLDGAGARPITAPELAGAHPSWSPDGRRLVYAAGPAGARQLHVVSAAGTNDRPLTTGPGDSHDPVWSRRGAVAFVQPTPTGTDIYRVSGRGGAPRRLTASIGDDRDPAWSPGGGQIAFVRNGSEIWVMSPYGRRPRRVIDLPGTVEGVAWSPDGRRLTFAGGPPGGRRVHTVRTDGRGLRTVSLPSSNGADPDWQSVGHDPVIAAAGDIACQPNGRSFREGLGTPRFCAMKRTSDLLLQADLRAVLALGDLQYERGELHNFFASFGPSWGRLNHLMRPVPGNHEYRTAGGRGYYDYFNGEGVRRGPGGDRIRGGYYSYDVGEWHVVALDSTCPHVLGGCGIGSPQQAWLALDLARNRTRCTLAYWHHPLFSSLAREEGRGPRETGALWQTLYDAGADVVLNGHQHFYERLAPQDANGTLDRERGIRGFVVGTGGKSLDNADFRDRNSVVFDANTFGVLELTLHPRSYEWRFRGAGPGALSDTGRDVCH